MLFKFIAVRIILASIFFIIIFLIFSELVGISFEQMRFIASNDISIIASIYIHFLAAPKFLLITMPYALLMANIFTYRKLSRSNELIALCSFGININKILVPSLLFSILIANITFHFQESVVTEFNYKTATTLEKAMSINRDDIKVHDLVYSQFDNFKYKREINLLLHAKIASSRAMEYLILLFFENGNLKKVITAQFASWQPKLSMWELHEGNEETLDINYIVKNKFKVSYLKTKNTLNQLLTQTRDNNELDISQLRKRIAIFEETGHKKEVIQLEQDIQERFITPLSCVVFSLVGASIGISLKPKSRVNEFGLGLIVIFIYFIIQFINSSLIGNETIPILSIWTPSLLGIFFSFFRLSKLC